MFRPDSNELAQCHIGHRFQKSEKRRFGVRYPKQKTYYILWLTKLFHSHIYIFQFLEMHRRQKISLQNRNKSYDGIFKTNQRAPRKFLRVGNIPPLHGEEETSVKMYDQWPWWKEGTNINPYPTAFPYGNGMVLHFYQQQESSTTKTVHKVINKGLKTYV